MDQSTLRRTPPSGSFQQLQQPHCSSSGGTRTTTPNKTGQSFASSNDTTSSFPRMTDLTSMQDFYLVHRHMNGEFLTVIEEDESDSSCVLHKGQLKKQSAVQCLSSLADSGLLPKYNEDPMDLEEEELLEASDCEPPSTEEEDDWGHFYADAATMDPSQYHSQQQQFMLAATFHNHARHCKQRRHHRRSHGAAKYPRGRCGSPGSPNVPKFSCLP